MNTSSDTKYEKPRIIQALLDGFNTIANRPFLILLPVLLDLFLWFGPSWRVDDYFQPLIQGLFESPFFSSPEYSELFDSLKEIWEEITTNLDLAFSLHTLPIGVPSLMVSKPPFINPFGNAPVINLRTELQIIMVWLLFVLTGYLLGSLYFRNISVNVITAGEDNTLNQFLKTFSQIILMPIILVFILIILTIPALFLFTLINFISPTISQFLMIAGGFAFLWILMPLIFTPHSVFLFKQNLIPAMMTSIRIVRTSMGKTAWYLLLCVLLIEGLNFLWMSPDVDNWLLLVGILGHAFIVTGVIASSFYFFIDATKYAQSIMEKQVKTT